MIVLFLYDVFMVFITPLFTKVPALTVHLVYGVALVTWVRAVAMVRTLALGVNQEATGLGPTTSVQV